MVGAPGAPLLILLLVVSGLTAGVSSEMAAATLASSPERIEHGRLWLLILSGLIAEHPVAASLVSFVLLAGLAHAVCGWRIFWTSALVGHVGSALLVYLLIGVAGLVA